MSENMANPEFEISEVDLGKDAEWKRVHPFTPLANSWAVIVALFAILLSQMQNGGVIEGLKYLERTDYLWLVWLISGGGIILLLALIILFSFLEWRVTKYALTDRAILFRKGLIFKSERHMRLNRIQAVDVVAPLVPRLLGLAKLHVDSAGASGSDIDVAYLKVSQCQSLRAEVLAKASGIKTPQREQASSGTNDTKLLELAESGIVGELPAAAGQAQEIPLYEILTGMLLGSIVRSLWFWLTLLMIPLMFFGAVMSSLAVIFDENDKLNTAKLVAAVPSLGIAIFAAIAASVGIIFTKLNEGWNFTAAISPDGIRLRHGFTTHDSQTIPPGRVHAVVLKQPFLWRKKDWWKVELTLAGYQGSDQSKKKTSSHVLLPVGTREQALQALWMVQRDLGAVTDLEGQEIGTAGTDLLQVLMYGSGPAPGLFVPPRHDRWLDWITWNRKAAVLTTTMVMIRDGRITHRVSFVPHSRMQSVAIDQGPLERAMGLANVRLHLVPGVVQTVVHHLEVSAAQHLWELQVRHADIARDQEPPEEWMRRIVSSLDN